MALSCFLIVFGSPTLPQRWPDRLAIWEMSVNGIISPDGTLPATTNVAVSGAAHGSFPFSLATSFQPSGHFFTIENPGTGPLRLTFDFTYNWNAAIGVNHPDREYADADVYLALFGFDPGVASIDIDGDNLGPLTDGVDEAWYIDNYFATDLGDTGGAGSGHLTGTIIVEGGQNVTFNVVSDVEGYAEAIPEPSGLALLMSGLLAAGLSGGFRLRSKTS